MMATVDTYIELLRSYLDDDITTDEFERRFFFVLGRDGRNHPQDIFSVIDKLSGYVDGYSDDPEYPVNV